MKLISDTKAIATPSSKIDSTLAMIAFAILSFALLYLDLQSGSGIPFVLFYFGLITFSVIYINARYAYFIATLTALECAYGIYSDYPPDKSFLSFIMQVTLYVCVHVLYCHVFSLLNDIYKFLKPSNNPLLSRELSQFSKLREFIYRPYVNNKWSLRNKIRAIEDHYQLVNSHAPLLNFPVSSSYDLAQIDIAGEKLRVVIDKPAWLRSEGEVCISLFYGVDRIYSSMILLARNASKIVLLIGNIQGDPRDRLDLYRKLTKALFGMRPRDFLLNVIKMIAAEIGCNEIMAITDHSHKNNHRFSKAQKVNTYNLIWTEHNGTEDKDSGFYRLPVDIRKRQENEIPANKRSMYRKRYELLDHIQTEIRTNVLKISQT